jgi:hypothetical protein
VRTCGRKLHTHYTGRTSSAGYHCAGKNITNGHGIYCLSVGAVQVDQAVAQAALAALAPIGIEASLAAAERLEADRDGALAQWRLAVERPSYEAQCTERRYRAVDPGNRLAPVSCSSQKSRSRRREDGLVPETLDGSCPHRLAKALMILRKVSNWRQLVVM